MKRCMIEIWNPQLKKSKWFPGVILGTVPGDINEDFERITVKTDDGRCYRDCHPNCVIESN